MTIGQKQRAFPLMVARLIQFADASGDAFAFGEALRTQEQADIYAMQKKGSRNSLHMLKLAIDLLLFKKDANGEWIWQKDSAAYKPYGDWWKDQSVPDHLECCWGGDFAGGGVVADGNHFSISHGGHK